MAKSSLAEWEDLQADEVHKHGKRIIFGKPGALAKMQSMWDEVLREVDAEAQHDKDSEEENHG